MTRESWDSACPPLTVGSQKWLLLHFAFQISHKFLFWPTLSMEGKDVNSVQHSSSLATMVQTHHCDFDLRPQLPHPQHLGVGLKETVGNIHVTVTISFSPSLASLPAKAAHRARSTCIAHGGAKRAQMLLQHWESLLAGLSPESQP